jgi:ABC-type multidrug transport system ATPase subunit
VAAGKQHTGICPVSFFVHAGCSISGGERRRVSLGVALAGSPLCLFLDEPTSGLDSSSALSLFQLLKELAAGGLTVVAVVHQPRAEVFAATDDLIVLGPGGSLFYGGPSVLPPPRPLLPPPFHSCRQLTFTAG